MFKKRVASIGVTLSLLNNTAPIMSTHATPSSYYERQDYTLTTLVGYIDVINEKLAIVQAERDDLQQKYDDVVTQLDRLQAIPVFDPNDITILSESSVYHLNKALEGTELQKLSMYFVEAEKRYGINAFALAGIVALESAWGTSEIAQRDNNLTGYAVYDGQGYGKVFASYEDCIYATAQLLANNYISPQGKYYTGSSLYNINTKYSSDKGWSVKVIKIARELINKSVQ